MIRTIRLNEELAGVEVLDNLNCIHGTLLRMNRFIFSRRSFGSKLLERLVLAVGTSVRLS